jgi:hypothetical protein
MSILAIHDRLMPCGTTSALRRHLARTEQCGTCRVVGAVPEHVWRRQPAAVAVRAPRVAAS